MDKSVLIPKCREKESTGMSRNWGSDLSRCFYGKSTFSRVKSGRQKPGASLVHEMQFWKAGPKTLGWEGGIGMLAPRVNLPSLSFVEGLPHLGSQWTVTLLNQSSRKTVSTQTIVISAEVSAHPLPSIQFSKAPWGLFKCNPYQMGQSILLKLSKHPLFLKCFFF